MSELANGILKLEHNSEWAAFQRDPAVAYQAGYYQCRRDAALLAREHEQADPVAQADADMQELKSILDAAPSPSGQIATIPAFDVTVKIDPQLATLGKWDERTAEITLREAPSTVPGAVIAVHESMHMAESLLIQQGIIGKRIGEAYVEQAASMVLYAMACMGMLKNIEPEQIVQFVNETIEDAYLKESKT